MGSHTHEFHGLWWTFGPFGRQDVHMHPCATTGCGSEMVGEGRTCGGPSTPHVEKRLSSTSKWSRKEAEGVPLCPGYTARTWTPGAPRPEDARCANCGGPEHADSGSSVDPS